MVPSLLVFELPRLTGQVLADVVLRKSATAGSLDGWGWRELKVLPLSWFDGLARILTKVEDLGVWPDGLLDAYIAMIPKTDGDATPLGQRPLCVLPIEMLGSSLGSLTLFSVLFRRASGHYLSWLVCHLSCLGSCSPFSSCFDFCTSFRFS